MPLIGGRRALLRPSKKLWTPLAAELQPYQPAWIDPSDPSTITLDGSNNISSIAAKGGTGIVWFQGTAANRPGNIGLAINFRSQQKLMPSSWPAQYDAIVALGTTAAIQSANAVLFETSVTGTAYSALVTSGGALQSYTGGYHQYGSLTWPPSTKGIGRFQQGSVLCASRDGGTLVTTSYTSGAVQCVGNEALTGYTLPIGDMYGAVICLPLPLNLAQKCEGFFAWLRARAGDIAFVNALDSGHPYKKQAPMLIPM